jgi:hypothetical protein
VKSGDENILQHLKLVTNQKPSRNEAEAAADVLWAAVAK